MLRIRQIVFAARDLDAAVSQFERGLGLKVAYRDPLVAEFGLRNALMALGDQFIEVVSPMRPNTAAGRHLDRHGDSAYMLILQTDDLDRDRARLAELGVRLVWQADYPDIRAVHIHPKDVGAAIVSFDQPQPPASWRWAGPDWQKHATPGQISDCTIGAVDPVALLQRWSTVLGTPAASKSLEISGGNLNFVNADSDLIQGYRISLGDRAARPQELTICGSRFQLG
jgi:catechol 2,3-dioxygenase-like lactoylglutathione lyase family enzyme